MKWHEFIFSNQAVQRWQRHVIFWLAWWIYFTSSYYYFHQPDLHNLGVWTKVPVMEMDNLPIMMTKSLLILLTHIFMCYSIIYFLLPHFLLKKRWGFLVTGLVLVGAITVVLGYLNYSLFFPLINSANHLNSGEDRVLWASVDAGILSTTKVVTVAVAIKLMKHWLTKQKEKERLEKEKIDTELKLLKAQIHPGFLFNSLNNIHTLALAGSPQAPAILLKLADLLSYMLYECDKQLVPLAKEIEMMHDYIKLEKTRLADSIEIEVRIKGDPAGKKIAPLLLLPFIAKSIKQSCSLSEDQPWIYLDLWIDNNELSMKLINGKSFVIQDSDTEEDIDLDNAIKRLQIVYPQKHKLKVNTEGEMLLTQLNIHLNEGITLNDQEQAIKTVPV